VSWPKGTEDSWYARTANRVCTPRQLEILQAKQAGISTRTIAAHLGISRATVRSHLEAADHKIRKAKEPT
jgi:DNA-binding CsgD family transcriptional regulator